MADAFCRLLQEPPLELPILIPATLLCAKLKAYQKESSAAMELLLWLRKPEAQERLSPSEKEEWAWWLTWVYLQKQEPHTAKQWLQTVWKKKRRNLSSLASQALILLWTQTDLTLGRLPNVSQGLQHLEEGWEQEPPAQLLFYPPGWPLASLQEQWYRQRIHLQVQECLPFFKKKMEQASQMQQAFRTQRGGFCLLEGLKFFKQAWQKGLSLAENWQEWQQAFTESQNIWGQLPSFWTNPLALGAQLSKAFDPPPLPTELLKTWKHFAQEWPQVSSPPPQK